MQTKPSKFLIFIIVFSIVISLGALGGITYLLFKTPDNPNTTNTNTSSSLTSTSSRSLISAMSYKPDVNFNFTLANLPKIDGSTSNVPLRSFILCKLLNYKCTWQEYTTDEAGLDKERYVNIDTSEANQNILKAKSVNSTTHNAYVKLINGETDIIFVATLPSTDELSLMTEKGVEFEIQPIAMDAFVFIANVNNSITGLTTEQILDVYTGKTTNWKDLGGTNSKLTAYQREDNSGSQELMKSLVLKGVKPIGAPEYIVSGMMGLINRVGGDVNGLGYSVYYYEQFMVKNSKLKLLSIDGIVPNYSTLDNQTYPFTSPVYVVTKKGLDTTSPAYNLANWMLTKEGQATVKESQYVPIVK